MAHGTLARRRTPALFAKTFIAPPLAASQSANTSAAHDAASAHMAPGMQLAPAPGQPGAMSTSSLPPVAKAASICEGVGYETGDGLQPLAPSLTRSCAA